MRLPSTTIPRPSSRAQAAHLSVVAHRGASAYVAENTLTAVRAAVELDADLVEVDVQRTRDGALVVVHDTTLARTTNAREIFPGRAPWRVADFTHAELRRLEVRAPGRHCPPGEAVPTLPEVIDALRGTGTGLLLELKAPHLYPGIVDDVALSTRSRGSDLAPDRFVVQSFDFTAMKELKTREPSMRVGLLGSPAASNLPALGTWADQINSHAPSVSRRYVDQVHALGMECLVWTVNRPSAMRRAVRMGVDGVITDRPDVLREVRSAVGLPAGRGRGPAA